MTIFIRSWEDLPTSLPIANGRPSRTSPLISARTSSLLFKRAAGSIVVLSLLVALTFFGYRFGFSHWRGEKLHYAIVLDCGSTGTRVHVYSWADTHTPGSQQTPVVTHLTPQRIVRTFLNRGPGQQREGLASYQRMETEPGLDKLLNNQSGIRAALEPLLQWAEMHIPSSNRRNTPLFLLATAGLRRLQISDAEWLLDGAWNILEKSPFLCRRSWVKVISGTEEAYYGWVALNYYLGRLGHITRQPTFGALDLGGSSLQVTFELEDVAGAEYGLNLSVGSIQHHLYAYSHTGFGLNDAFDRSVALLFRQLPRDRGDETVEVHHPCLHEGYGHLYLCSHCSLLSSSSLLSLSGSPHGDEKGIGKKGKVPMIELVGEPNWEACQALASTIVNSFMPLKSLPSLDCEDIRCALGKHQPPPHGQFYALSGFFAVYKFFDLPATAHFEALLKKAMEFCRKTWLDAQESVVPQPHLEQYCFRAPYVVWVAS